MRHPGGFYHCGLHIPGNLPCPYPALYLIGWVKPPITDRSRDIAPGATIRRYACLGHLQAAVDDALDQFRIGPITIDSSGRRPACSECGGVGCERCVPGGF